MEFFTIRRCRNSQGIGLPFWIRFVDNIVSNFAVLNLNTASYENNSLLLALAK